MFNFRRLRAQSIPINMHSGQMSAHALLIQDIRDVAVIIAFRFQFHSLEVKQLMKAVILYSGICKGVISFAS